MVNHNLPKIVVDHEVSDSVTIEVLSVVDDQSYLTRYGFTANGKPRVRSVDRVFSFYTRMRGIPLLKVVVNHRGPGSASVYCDGVHQPSSVAGFVDDLVVTLIGI